MFSAVISKKTGATSLNRKPISIKNSKKTVPESPMAVWWVKYQGG